MKEKNNLFRYRVDIRAEEYAEKVEKYGSSLKDKKNNKWKND